MQEMKLWEVSTRLIPPLAILDIGLVYGFIFFRDDAWVDVIIDE